MADKGPENVSPIKFAGKLKPAESVPFANKLVNAFLDRTIAAHGVGTMLHPDELKAWDLLLNVSDVDAAKRGGVPIDQPIEMIRGLLDKMAKNMPNN